VFNATFSNISAISWQPALVVDEVGVPSENHRPWANNWLALSSAAMNNIKTLIINLYFTDTNIKKSIIN
jgi:hypothetical protein